MELLKVCMCEMDVAMLFLMLVSDAIMVVEGDEDDSKVEHDIYRLFICSKH